MWEGRGSTLALKGLMPSFFLKRDYIEHSTAHAVEMGVAIVLSFSMSITRV